MTAENKPSFRTEAVEFVKALRSLAQMASDPRTDPLFTSIKYRTDQFVEKNISGPVKHIAIKVLLWTDSLLPDPRGERD